MTSQLNQSAENKSELVFDDRVLNVERIKQMIPHRYPFLLVDKVKKIIRDVQATGVKNVTINEPFFEGHFPGRPIMPGVLIIEAMAQTAGVFVVDTLGPESEGKLVYFMTIEEARFRRPVEPGDTLEILVEKIRHRANVWKFTGKATVDGVLCAEATFSAMIIDRADADKK